MRTRFILIAILIAAMAPVFALPPKNKPTQPKTEPPVSDLAPVSALNADGYAELNKWYAIGSEKNLAICIDSLEYSVTRVNIGDFTYITGVDEKFIVAKYRIRNESKDDLYVGLEEIVLSAIDINGNTCEQIYDLGVENTKKTLSNTLEPGQVVNVYTALTANYKGSCEKLTVTCRENKIKYKLTNKVKLLNPPYVDPSDKFKTTALQEIPAEYKTNYPLSLFDVKVDGYSYADTISVGGENQDPGEGNHYLIVDMTVKNATLVQQYFGSEEVKIDAINEEGIPFSNNDFTYYANGRDWVSIELKPAQELKIKIAVILDVNEKITHFNLWETSDKPSRIHIFKVEKEETE